jgi:3'(2'), 5'-bisphosphate nucleotidase
VNERVCSLPSLRQLAAIAEEAGAAILRIYASAQPRVSMKADDSPLTEADLAADAIIRRGLALDFAGCAIVSEEQADDVAGAARPEGYFLVDPLDGTREFLARNGEFTVNIAWVVAHEVRAGVVHAPAVGETYFGASGVGAWRREAALRVGPEVGQAVGPSTGPKAQHDSRGGEQSIAVRAAAAGAPLRILASRSHGGAAQERFLAAVPVANQTLAAGSSLKFCRIAEGAADLYPRLSPTMAWDTAAGQAVLQAAGGAVLRTDGAPLAVPGEPHAAPNPHFMAAASIALAREAWAWAARA